MSLLGKKMDLEIEKVLKENTFIDDIPQLIEKCPTCQSVNSYGSYSLAFMGIVSYTNEPFILLLVGNYKVEYFERVFINVFNLDTILRELVKTVIAVFSFNIEEAQSEITFIINEMIKEKIIEFDQFAFEEYKFDNAEDRKLQLDTYKRTLKNHEEMEYIKNLIKEFKRNSTDVLYYRK